MAGVLSWQFVFLMLITAVHLKDCASVRRKRQMGMMGAGGLAGMAPGMGGMMMAPGMMPPPGMAMGSPYGYGGTNGWVNPGHGGGASYQSGFTCGAICGIHLRACNLPCSTNFWTHRCAVCVGPKWDSCRHCFGSGNGAQTGMFNDWGYM